MLAAGREPVARARFREWLWERYGDLDTLGEAWGRCFGEWNEVRPPTWKLAFSDWVDWRTFTAENTGSLVARRTAVTQRHSKAPAYRGCLRGAGDPGSRPSAGELRRGGPPLPGAWKP